MTPRRRLNRRSFLGQVAGGAAAAGALGLISGEARAWQTGTYTGVTDNDSGSHADSGGYGRGPGGNLYGQPAQPDTGQTGYSDSDSGPNADPSGHGRRGQRPQTGVTDGDPGDPIGHGRGTGRQSAYGARARPDGSQAEYTGVTDTDSGPNRDPYNYGRGGRVCSDNDSTQQPDSRYRDPVRHCM